MFARKKGVFSLMGRAGAVATVMAVALTALEPSMALAGSAPKGNDRDQRRDRYQRPSPVLSRWRWCRGSRGLCRYRRHGHRDRGQPEPARLL
jgi:hypothetical protein